MGRVSFLLRSAARIAPLAYPMIKKGAAMLRENPELARVGQDMVDRLGKARAARSRPEGLHRSVAVLRAKAEEVLARAQTPDDVARAERWLVQANQLDAAVDLMTIHDRKRQAQDAAPIEARVEELFGEIFTALVEEQSDSPPPQLPS